MIVLTKPQRESLFNLVRRDFPSWLPFRQNSIACEEKIVTWSGTSFPIQAVWRPLRIRLAQPTGANGTSGIGVGDKRSWLPSEDNWINFVVLASLSF